MIDSRAVAAAMRDVVCGDRMPAVERNANVGFQLTRGLLGISMSAECLVEEGFNESLQSK